MSLLEKAGACIGDIGTAKTNKNRRANMERDWNRYTLSDSWFESGYDRGYECTDCEEYETKLDSARDYLSAIVKQLYTEDILDLDGLEEDIDALCNILGVRIGKGDLQIQRKRVSMPEYVFEWVDFNNEYLRKIAK